MKIQLRLINQTPCDLTLFTWLVPQWSAHILVPLQHEDSYPRISSLGGGRARRRPAVPVRKTLLHPAGLLPPTPRPVELHDCILDQLCQDWVIFQHALQRHSGKLEASNFLLARPVLFEYTVSCTAVVRTGLQSDFIYTGTTGLNVNCQCSFGFFILKKDV